ncbi:DsrE family protein [Sedimenticola sp.]|uniref:DsrE family protein n=1 Tax=Sedimenticola sp. TaxID=1940285 RepID=UPI002582F2D5|nr:DsrE family protein [Sedimenticola sp.]MCW8903200.1 DsrE family protein [Sedimenticola sp.]
MKTINHSLMALLLFFGLFTGQPLLAAEGAPHKVVIQVSTDDPRTQTIALNNAVNLQKALGQDNVQIEIVAYGPGLGMLTSNSKEGQRITSLAMQDIQFSACGNTMKGIEKKTGKMPALLEGVTVVEAGVLRLMELQEQGYAYVRP